MSPVLGGSRSDVVDWPLVAVHAALLPNGKVLAWDAMPGDADEDPHTTGNHTTRVTLWDPVTDTHVETTNDTDLFCADSTPLWDGRIPFAGGNDDGNELVSTSGAVFTPELRDLATGAFRTPNPTNADRRYHSIALLLADRRVLSARGGIRGRCYETGYEKRNGAVVTPLYPCAGDARLAPRSTLRDVPAEASHGALPSVGTSAGASIRRAHLIKPGSVTHSQHQDRRLVPLAFEQRGDTLELDVSRDEPTRADSVARAACRADGGRARCGAARSRPTTRRRGA